MMQNSSTKSNEKHIRLYNPNRCNGLDAGICYIVILLVFMTLPYAIRFLIGDFLKSISKFDTFAYNVISVAISQSAIFAVAFIYCLIRRVNPFSGGGYKASFDGIHVLMATMLIMGIMMLFYFTHLQFYSYASTIVGPSSTIEEVLSPFSIIFILVYFVEVAVFPAIAEEMLFRGIIMRGLEQFGGVFAVVCSSAMFSLMHGNFGQIILQFIGGLAIGTVVYITKNYLLGCLMHLINNSFSVVYTLLITPIFNGPISAKVSAVSGAATIALGVIFCLVGGIYFISMLIEKEKNKILNKKNTNIYERKRYYQMKVDGEDLLVNSDEVPFLTGKNEFDDRMFIIHGRYRRLNRKANTTIAYVCLGLSIVFATIMLFFGL